MGSTRPSCSRLRARGRPLTRSKSPPWNGSTGSTTADSTNTAETCHRLSAKPCTTVITELSTPPSSQPRKSLDTPGRFTPLPHRHHRVDELTLAATDPIPTDLATTLAKIHSSGAH